MTITKELLHFAVLDIDYEYLSEGLRPFTNTNNPCHLTCYYTTVEPRRHKISRVIRGLPHFSGAYWCFVAWKTVEQNESGDTLHHTFDLVPWPVCETRWFTFTGTVGPNFSPSASPLFEKHCDHHLTIGIFPAKSTSNTVSTPTHIFNYLLAHDGYSARVFPPASYYHLGQEFASYMYLIGRLGFFFDTQAIKKEWPAKSATFTFRVYQCFTTAESYVLVNGDSLHEPVSPLDYHGLLSEIVSLGSTPATGPNRWKTITLNSLGLAKITPEGTTKLAMRTSKDIQVIPPTDWEYHLIYSAITGSAPYLTVTY